MIEGFVEAIQSNHATGWAADVATSSIIDVVLRTPAEILVKTSPVFARPDVESIKGVTTSSGFYIAYENLCFLLKSGQATLEAGTASMGYWPLQLIEGAYADQWEQYQSFDDTPGAASSSGVKLTALRLQDLDYLKGQGIRILDIGCNEGFFANALSNYFSPAYVLGVDRSEHFIERARQRYPHAKFKAKSWWDVEEGDFDIIIFLSAVHYERRQRELFAFLHAKLSFRGVVILECGVADPLMLDASERWVVAHRHDGLIRYPT